MLKCENKISNDEIEKVSGGLNLEKDSMVTKNPGGKSKNNSNIDHFKNIIHSDDKKKK